MHIQRKFLWIAVPIFAAIVSPAPIDPDRWAIVNDTLYLNYSTRTQRDFVAEIYAQIEQADAHWVEQRPELTGE